MGNPDGQHISTSYAERMNLQIRIGDEALYKINERSQQED